MFDRISRSWALAGACWDVLMEDPALLIFPLLSGLAIVLLMASFAWPVWLVYHGLQSAPADGSTTPTLRLSSYATTYVFYVITYSIVMFFNTALIGAAWTLATAMTLPILIVEKVGPLEAISRSLDLLRRNWGENLIGNVGIS